MVARLAVTAIMLLLAAAAFLLPAGCDNCQETHGAPFAILFVVIAAVAWFKWEIIREGFGAAKGESQIPIIRLGSKDIGGLWRLMRRRPQRRTPSSS